jgi:hypothetical protein
MHARRSPVRRTATWRSPSGGLACHAASTLAPSKGLSPASNNRATWTADSAELDRVRELPGILQQLEHDIIGESDRDDALPRLVLEVIVDERRRHLDQRFCRRRRAREHGLRRNIGRLKERYPRVARYYKLTEGVPLALTFSSVTLSHRGGEICYVFRRTRCGPRS